MKNLIRLLTASVFVLTVISSPARAHHVALPDNMSEVHATWLWGMYTLPASITSDHSSYWYSHPHTDVNQIDNPEWTEIANKQVRPRATVPAVLLMHGCGGLVRGPHALRVHLMSQGYAVFEPDSFARPGRTCNRTSLYKRTEELAYALEQIHQAPWVDQDRIVLMGVSQGGAAVANWNLPGFLAHVILADNCDGHKPAAPANTPVLVITGENDSFVNVKRCDIDQQSPGSRFVTIRGAGHEVTDYPDTLKEITNFLDHL